MSNDKQSSIDWLVSQLKISTYWDTLITELEWMDLEIDDIIEKAKAMHKIEIEDSFDEGCYHSSDFPKTTDAEKYYKETFE